MKFFVFFLLLASFQFGTANAGPSRIAEIQKLKQQLSSASAAKKFYIQTEIADHYASEPLNASNVAEAELYAEIILKQAKNYKTSKSYGYAVHIGNLVLGRVQLFKKDISGAKKYLNLATKSPGSPTMNSFGPNMTLAAELLEKGEKQAVLKYIDHCLKFWKSSSAKFLTDNWKATIKKGKVPDFGPNLIY